MYDLCISVHIRMVMVIVRQHTHKHYTVRQDVTLITANFQYCFCLLVPAKSNSIDFVHLRKNMCLSFYIFADEFTVSIYICVEISVCAQVQLYGHDCAYISVSVCVA